jgi:hypothetical protein
MLLKKIKFYICFFLVEISYNCVQQKKIMLRQFIYKLLNLNRHSKKMLSAIRIFTTS